MEFFRRIGNAVARFMYGRNGMDQLNVAMLRVYIGAFVAQMVFLLLKAEAPAVLAEILMWLLMLFILFRMFSKNLPKRQLENQKWISWWWKVKSSNAGARARHADKEHRYFTCKHCKAICRVPTGKGKIIITCPKCGAQIQAKT